jgi:hypothetical protein
VTECVYCAVRTVFMCFVWISEQTAIFSHKAKTIHYRPLGFDDVEAPRYLDNRHLNVVRLSALRTGLYPLPFTLLPPGNIPGTHFCQRLSRPQGRSATEKIMSMKNCNYTIGNRTRDLPASAVPQPTAPPRTPSFLIAPMKCLLRCAN